MKSLVPVLFWSQTHNQAVCVSCSWRRVLGPLRLAWKTWRFPCFSVVTEATQGASRGPLKGAVSAQKALQGSETETRELLGWLEDKSTYYPNEGYWFALHRQFFFYLFDPLSFNCFRPSEKKSVLITRHGIQLFEVIWSSFELESTWVIESTNSNRFSWTTLRPHLTKVSTALGLRVSPSCWASCW